MQTTRRGMDCRLIDMYRAVDLRSPRPLAVVKHPVHATLSTNTFAYLFNIYFATRTVTSFTKTIIVIVNENIVRRLNKKLMSADASNDIV